MNIYLELIVESIELLKYLCSLFRRVEGPFLIITCISAGSLVTYSDHLHSGSLRKRSTTKKNLSLCRTAKIKIIIKDEK